MMQKLLILSALQTVAAQQSGSQTQEAHPSLSYSECDASGCQSKPGKVTVDANWRWLHGQGGTNNCYTGNEWDKTLCPDVATCSKNCVVEGAGAEYENTYGVQASGDKLTLGFVTQGPYSRNVGSRNYLLDSEDTYKLFKLKNKEFTYTVDDSNLDCGLNGALYFVQMEADGGASKYGNAGAKYGLGYCDAQCPSDLKFINGEANSEGWKPSATDPNAGNGKYGSCCTEIDIWEANKISTAFTLHSCDVEEQTRCEGADCGNGDDRFKSVCDRNGCDMQSHRLGNENFFGPGSNFQVDSTKPIQVTTQFITDDNTDSGNLVEVKQFYTQDGKTIEHPSYTVNGKQHDRLTEEYCQDWVATTKDGTNFIQKGGFKGMDKALEKGVVLVMSLWDDHDVNMLWLDSIYPTDGSQPGSKRGSCAITSGVPKDVESKQADANVKFSDIKVGPIGSTVKPSPSPTPSPTPTPAPTPSPTPSDCPGGSLDACIDLCPADAFAACVKSCQRRCASAVSV